MEWTHLLTLQRTVASILREAKNPLSPEEITVRASDTLGQQKLPVALISFVLRAHPQQFVSADGRGWVLVHEPSAATPPATACSDAAPPDKAGLDSLVTAWQTWSGAASLAPETEATGSE